MGIYIQFLQSIDFFCKSKIGNLKFKIWVFEHINIIILVNDCENHKAYFIVYKYNVDIWDIIYYFWNHYIYFYDSKTELSSTFQKFDLQNNMICILPFTRQ